MFLSGRLKWKTSQKEGNSKHTRIGDSGQVPGHVDGPHNTAACIIRMKRDKVYVHKHVPRVLHLYAELYHRLSVEERHGSQWNAAGLGTCKRFSVRKCQAN